MEEKEPIVVDGANVAYAEMSKEGDPRVSNLVDMRRYLQQAGYTPIIIVDASVRYEIDDPKQLEALLDRQAVRQAPSDTDADFFILETAKQHNAKIVTNDKFDQFRDEYPWIEERRVPFMIIDGEIILYKRQLSEEK